MLLAPWARACSSASPSSFVPIPQRDSYPSNVYRGAVLLIVNAMTGETQHGRLIVDRADGDEEDFTAFHCVHVQVGCETGTPRVNDFGRIEA